MEKDYQEMNAQVLFANKNRKTVMSKWLFFILVIMYTFAYNNDLRNESSLVWYAISAGTIGYLAFMIAFSSYKEQSIGIYAIWAFVFFVYTFLSGFWTINESEYFSKIKSLFLLFIVNVLLSFTVETKEDVRKILFANFIALVFYLIYVLLKVDLSQLGEDRLGVDLLGARWNANDVGLKLCVGFSIAVYFGMEQKSLVWKLFFFAIGLFFAGVGLFTGSRKVFLMLAGILVLFLFLKSKHKWLSLIIAAVSIIVLYFAIMKIEPLYNVLGKRVESMLEGLFGEGTTEGSFNTREEMIKLGWGWFLERPIFGYGLGGSFVLYGNIFGEEMYSHNNFIETLLNGGIVGFVIYYFIYGYIFVKLFKLVFVKRDWTAIVLVSVNFVLLVLQIAYVSYISTLENCLLMLAVAYIKVGGNKHENS